MSNYCIIEKESSSIQNIKNILKEYGDFNCIGVSSTYDNAMNIILKKLPNLVFFNIDNIVERPFEFVNELSQYCETDKVPKFIAMSSTKEKAYDVIKNGFLDYLLMPLRELDLRKIVLKYEKKHKEEQRSTICLKSYKDYRYINTDEILFLRADNNTTDFHMNDGTTISAFKTLKTFQDLLPKQFLRIHKSYIINKDYVSRINYGKLICTVSNSKLDIPFTKTYLDNVENINKALSETSFLALN